MDQDFKEQVELEVRRITSAQELEMRKLHSEEAREFREFLQKQFRYITFGVTTFAIVGAALFIWFFSDSVEKTREEMRATVDAKLIDYRIVGSLKDRLKDLVELAAKNDTTSEIIESKVLETSQRVVKEIADQLIKDAVATEVNSIEALDLDGLLFRALIPSGAILAFDTPSGCPDGWDSFVDAQSRFIVGASFGMRGNIPLSQPLTPHKYRAHGGDEWVSLTVAQMPTHSHSILRTDSDGDGNFVKWTAMGSPNNRSTGSGIGSAGESQPHPNMPPYIALYFCKKD